MYGLLPNAVESAVLKVTDKLDTVVPCLIIVAVMNPSASEAFCVRTSSSNVIA